MKLDVRSKKVKIRIKYKSWKKKGEFTHSMRQYHLYFDIKGCLKKNYRIKKRVNKILHQPNVLTWWWIATHPRIESTHISVGHTATINDVVLHHFVTRGSGLFFIYPIRLTPMFCRHLSKLHRSCAENRNPTAKPLPLKTKIRRGWLNEPLEIIWKRFVVQENIRISIIPIKPVFNRPHCPDRAIQVRVPG